MAKKYKESELPRTSKYKIKEHLGVLVHDTVTPLDGSKYWTRERVISMCANGVKQPKGWIPGPLYHTLIFKNGEIVRITDYAWKSNNAGRGYGKRLDMLREGKDPLSIKLGSDSTNGNPYLIGVALARFGKRPIPSDMFKSLQTAIKGIYKEVGWNSSETWRVMRHADWSKRKVDAEKLDLKQLMKFAVPEVTEHEVLEYILSSKGRNIAPANNYEVVVRIQKLIGAKVTGQFDDQTRDALRRFYPHW